MVYMMGGLAGSMICQSLMIESVAVVDAFPHTMQDGAGRNQKTSNSAQRGCPLQYVVFLKP